MRYIVLAMPEVTLGRSTECDIHVDDDEASRVHAQLDRSKGYWQLTDQDSTNGVFLNGQRISSHPLVGGELFRIGGTFFRFFSRGISPESRDYKVPEGPFVAGPAFDGFWEILDRAAKSDLTVLVHGETGTGKELIASFLHEQGERRCGTFVPVNCAAIPRNLFESELFGHVKGSFSGATSDKLGLLRHASGGTLFLDEIGELPLDCQAKLLRFLQDRTVWPVGSTRSYKVDTRLVCATNRDLERLVHDELFRADLYARVAELVIGLPPLRERREDIPLLVEHFLRKHGEGEDWGVTAPAMEHLCLQRWRFNVRQLETATRRAMLFAGRAGTLEVEHFVEKVWGPKLSCAGTEGSPGRASTPAPKNVAPEGAEETPAEPEPASATPPPEDPRIQRITDVLERHQGNVNEAADELGISRSQLYRRAKKLGINVAHFRR